MHPWVLRIQICSNGEPRNFPRGIITKFRKLNCQYIKKNHSKGNNYEIPETILTIYKKNSQDPLGEFSTNIDTKHPWMEGMYHFVKMKDREPFGREDN